MTSWSDQDLRRMENHGISHLEADRQLDLLAFPPIPPQLDRPATLGDGICKLTLDEQENVLAYLNRNAWPAILRNLSQLQALHPVCFLT